MQDNTFYLVVISPDTSLVCDSLLGFFLGFDDLGNIEACPWIAVQRPFGFFCLMSSSQSDGVTWFWDEDHRGKVLLPSHHIEGFTLST